MTEKVKPVDLDELLQTAAMAGATDVLLSPAPHVGKLIVRAASTTLMSRVVDPGLLRSLSTQLSLRTGQPALLGGGPQTLDASIASFEMTSRETTMRVRVICTATPSGPMVRLRLQSRDLLRRALAQFQEGRFGGREVVRHLAEPAGVVFVAGPTSGGKTSALHHLTASLPAARTVCLISQAEEFVATDGASCRPEDAQVVVLDEMDETDKITVAMGLGASRLVLATLVAPTLEMALRRVRGAQPDIAPLIGVLRVDWRADGALRLPAYRWFGVEGRAPEPRIPRALLEHMDVLEAFQALGKLEAP
mgnify:CR=1 FL=1